MTEKIFHLERDYEPAGDQPQAIETLVDGIESGLARQTLLGVTGSGKSIGYDDPLFIERYEGGEFVARIVTAGPFIDGLLAAQGLGDQDGETEQFACADGMYFTQAFDPATGVTGRFPVAALLRHRAPQQVFRVTTACGRSVAATADHNLWVLRDGALTLLRTEEVRAGDCLPVPETIEASSDLRTLDLLQYLAEADLGVLSEERATAVGSDLAGGGESAAIIGHERREGRLPARMPLSDALLAVLGNYIAAGEAELGRSCDLAISSAVFAALLAKLCGRRSVDKRLPDFWPQLSNRSLGILLRAYFDGRGAVGTPDDGVSATASGGLASDLAYALKRFGIHAQLRRQAEPAGGVTEETFSVAISGRDLLRYARSIGFRHPDKRARLEAIVGRADAVTELAPYVRGPLQRLHGTCWTPVDEIAEMEYAHPYVYDLSVPGAETFLAGTGGVIVHNTFTMANVVSAVQRPTLILAHNKTLAAQLYGEMREFFPHNAVEYFVSYYDYYQPEAYVPSSDTYIEKDASINDHIEQMRLSATKALLERRDVVIVATVSAIYGLGDPEAYHAMVLHLVRGASINQRDMLRRLAELQYTRNPLDLARGTYRVRGDVIDIFPAESEQEAVRVELFDDEIETISLFDPLTGAVLRKLPRVTIYPKTHYVTPRETLLNAVELIRADLAIRLNELRDANRLVEAQRLEQRTRFDMEMILEVGYCNGIENYSRYLSGRRPGEPPPCLFDYLPPDALLFIDESHVTVPQLGAMYRGDRSRKETLVEYGFRLPSALDNRPLQFEEFEAIAPQTVFVSATPSRYENERSDNVVEQVVRPTGLIDPEVEIRPAGIQVDDVLSEINARAAADERVLITTLTKRMAEDLTEYLQEHGVRVRYLHSDIETVERTEIIRDLRLGEFDVLVGINLLREGLDMPEVSLVAIFDADKEGFLRSEGSLIQTIGRAARNVNGKAILYADRITGSMQRAIEETDRRRAKQIAFNAAHGIEPRSIKKAVQDIMEGARYVPRRRQRGRDEIEGAVDMSPADALAKVQQLEKQMYRHARDLEFEQAARLRDEIQALRKVGLGLGADTVK